MVSKDIGEDLKILFKNNRYIALEDKKETILNFLQNNINTSLTEALHQENNNEKENQEFNAKDLDLSDSVLDLLLDRVAQQLTIGEFNTILQGIFGKYDEVFLLASDFYSMDKDIPQSLEITDNDNVYKITFDIIDEIDEIIQITDVEEEGNS